MWPVTIELGSGVENFEVIPSSNLFCSIQCLIHYESILASTIFSGSAHLLQIMKRGINVVPGQWTLDTPVVLDHWTEHNRWYKLIIFDQIVFDSYNNRTNIRKRLFRNSIFWLMIYRLYFTMNNTWHVLLL